MSREGSISNVPPAAFGRFRVLHQLKAGSLGPVFRGEDPDNGASVAITHLDGAMPADVAGRAVRELRSLIGRVPDSAALAQVLDAGLEGGRPFVVSPLAAGEPLDVALRQYGPADFADALPRLQLLADALDRAAEEGICHGAIHPRDITVSSDATQLLGVGIAPALERAGVRLAGAPPYSPPDVLAGEPRRRAADQFGLAAVAYEWIFGGRVAAAGGATIWVPALPGADADLLTEAFSTALATDPADRFRSCAEFVAAIRQAARVAPHAVAGADQASPPPAPIVLDLPLEADDVVGDAALRVSDDRPPALSSDEPPAFAITPDRAGRTARPFPLAVLFVVLGLGVGLGWAAGFLFIPPASEPPSSSAFDVPPPSPVASPPGASAPSGPAREFTEAPVTAASAPSAAEEAPAGVEQALPASRATGATDAAVEPEAARLLVRSTPAGATVTIDGALRGVTPLAVRDLPLGTRAVVIERPGYVPVERRIALTRDRPSRSLEVPLNPAAGVPAARRPVARVITGSLLVESRPPGATVLLDDRVAGVTPLTLTEVTPGTYAVRLQRPGYADWATSVTVTAGARARVAASLAGGQREE